MDSEKNRREVVEYFKVAGSQTNNRTVYIRMQMSNFIADINPFLVDRLSVIAFLALLEHEFL